MRHAIVPEVKVEIKGRANDTAEFVNMKADLFREVKMIVTQELNMKNPEHGLPNRIAEQE